MARVVLRIAFRKPGITHVLNSVFNSAHFLVFSMCLCERGRSWSYSVARKVKIVQTWNGIAHFLLDLTGSETPVICWWKSS